MLSAICKIIAVSAVAGFLILQCASPNQVAGGSSSETVIGRLSNADGSPAQSAVVTMYPADYDPISNPSFLKSSTDTTDINGLYSLKAPDSSDRYSIVASKQDSGTLAMVTAVMLLGDTTRVRDAVLSKPGAISVAVPDIADMANGYLFIPGTPIAVFLSGQSGLVLFNQVPAGTIPSINYASKAAVGASSIVTSGIELTSGDTVVIPFPQWRYSRKLYLNTTASGAGVSGDVADFPMLIRLTGSTFDFSQAQTGGADLRFSNAEGASLAYEIERWDAAENAAEIWVRVPFVHGNNDSQYIVMHWGASIGSATGFLSNGAKVFDTSCGFQGVWHLSGEGNGTAFDATANQYHGTPDNVAAASAVAGAIGIAREFNGASDGIQMKGTAGSKLNFPENGRYTVSAWVYSDTLDDKWHLIVGKSNGQYYLKQQIKSRNGNWEFVEYHDKSGWQLSESPMTLKTWKYLTGVREGDRQYLYIDGQIADSTIKPNYDTASRNTSDDVTIGRFQTSVKYENEGFCFFDGKIDEVRISSIARSADWVKLCFMNQRGDERLIVFK